MQLVAAAMLGGLAVWSWLRWRGARRVGSERSTTPPAASPLSRSSAENPAPSPLPNSSAENAALSPVDSSGETPALSSHVHSADASTPSRRSRSAAVSVSSPLSPEDGRPASPDAALASAQHAVLVAMQRMAATWVNEHPVRVIKLPADDLKGRIIGREGRNIRAFEAATGVDVLIDDTPDVLVLSCFHPMRREIAARALLRLMADGRVHPTRIEAAVEAATGEVEADARGRARDGVRDLAIGDLPEAVWGALGQLAWHGEGGQNQLDHAVETATLAGLLAAELQWTPAQVQQAQRAGLLHDVGKTVDAAQAGEHGAAGAAWLARLGETPEIVNAVAQHHQANPDSLLAVLVQAANRMSAERPGARRAALGRNIARLTRLEDLARECLGVEKAFAIQAGREIRVVVDSTLVSDDEAEVLGHDIARRIQDELSYASEVRVTVIRQIRATQVAR